MEHYFTNNEQLKSELRDITYTLDDTNFTFISDNGVFSKNKIDYGSKFLVETMLKQINKTHISILDMGCGYGFIGIVLAKKLDSLVTLADVNKRALHLAKENFKVNKVEAHIIESNIYDNRKQELPVVTDITIDASEQTPFAYGEENDELAYQIKASWNYTSSNFSDYQNEATLIFVHEGNKLSLVELK